MKTTINFSGGPWNGRRESMDLKEGQKVSTLDVPCKDGFYARYACQGGHDKGATSVEVSYDRLLSRDDLTRTQKQPAFDIMATETNVSEWKPLSEAKPEVGRLVMVGHLDQAGKPYNVTMACMDENGHFRFSTSAERTIGWQPSCWKLRF